MFALFAAADSTATPVAEGVRIFGVTVPGWAISSIVVIGGIYVIIRALRKLVPEAGGLASDLMEQLNKLSRRQDHVAEAVLNIAQAEPKPADASQKRAKAVAHAEAAMALSTTAGTATTPQVEPLPPPTDPEPPAGDGGEQ
jgi:hypothetical protein